MAKVFKFQSSPKEQLDLTVNKATVIIRKALEKNTNVVSVDDILFFEGVHNSFYKIVSISIFNTIVEAIDAFNLNDIYPKRNKEELLKGYKKAYPKALPQKWKFIAFKLVALEDVPNYTTFQNFSYKPLEF